MRKPVRVSSSIQSKLAAKPCSQFINHWHAVIPLKSTIQSNQPIARVACLPAGAEGVADNTHHFPAGLLQRRGAAHAGLLHVLLRCSAVIRQYPASGCHQ